ncbi:MAG: hypothetical protein H6742_19795 [Alphaproteobacteria bacterium]|nr:hypothetical protein [Alphaproteobacteria bacterium]
MPPVFLPIRHTWDGRDADPGEHASVVVKLRDDGLLVQIDAPFHGDPPPPGPAGPTWALWEHEVVELFVLGADDRYLELELSPHGHHLGLQLHGVRTITERLLPLQPDTRLHAGRWTSTLLVPLALLPPSPSHANAYAIHGSGDARRYLAHAPVPGPAPDFHRLQHFPRVELSGAGRRFSR